MANQFTLKNGGYEPFIGNFGLVPQPPIPEPDAEDNGKVLGVSNGSYALVNGGGGGSGTVQYVVNTLYNENQNSYLDKTWAEIKAAFDAGKMVVLKEHDSSESEGVTQTIDGIYPLSAIYSNIGTGEIESAVYTVHFNEMLYTSDSEDGVLTISY